LADLIECLLAGDKRDLTRLDLSDATPNLLDLCALDLWRNAVRQCLDKTISKFGAFRWGKLLDLGKDVGNGLGHGNSLFGTFIVASALSTTQYSDGGHEAGRLELKRDAAVRCAWLGRDCVNVKLNLIMLNPRLDCETCGLKKREHKLGCATLPKLAHLPSVCQAPKQRLCVLRRNCWPQDRMRLTKKVNCGSLSRYHAQTLRVISHQERQQICHVVFVGSVHVVERPSQS